MAPEVWNSLAREPWCCPVVEPLEGMAPRLWEQMVPEVEVDAGRAVSPAAAQARGWGEGLLLLVGTHASKKAGPRDRKAHLVV